MSRVSCLLPKSQPFLFSAFAFLVSQACVGTLLCFVRSRVACATAADTVCLPYEVYVAYSGLGECAKFSLPSFTLFSVNLEAFHHQAKASGHSRTI